jgi:hypothetical protein
MSLFRQILHAIQARLIRPLALHALLERSLSSPDAAYRSYADKMRLENCSTLAALHNSSTSEQRHKALQGLGGYADDAPALMTVGP